MSNAQSMQEQLAACLSTQEVRCVVNNFCTEFGDVVNVTLLCGEQHPGKTLCVVDFARENTRTSLCANALGGQIFGFSSIIFKFQKHPDSVCIQALSEDAPSCSCTARAG